MAYLAISSLPIFLSFSPSFGICPLSRWVKNLWQLQVLLPPGSPLQPLGDKTTVFSLSVTIVPEKLLCVHLFQKYYELFQEITFEFQDFTHSMCSKNVGGLNRLT